MRVVENALGLIHETPLVALKRIAPGLRIVAKAEFLNPSGSIKDRMALVMIESAEASGLLKPGTTLVEATTGNTGISFGMVCALKGYEFIAVMPEGQSIEREKIMRGFGARVVLTPRRQGTAGAVAVAQRLALKPQHLMLGQFVNPDNPLSHHATGAEIWHQTGGKVDAFVAGVGTGGTLAGVAQYLKSQGCKARIVAVEPASCAVLSGGKRGRHAIEGIGEGFLPKVVADNLDLIDEVVRVTDADAISMTRRLMAEEGLFVGISSGANVWASLHVAQELGKHATVVTILPDSGQRYLSTKLFK